ncbi:hypothetical protein, conserved [Plasmodium gonderi]|uniref:Uncharacterized protein n=1 Tax=Plasmodium gonderi TaxID=77519 RepID=A0A1Y1JGE1_PLAGO|nr:hypothetical protein, conserved [Plasmodium gonderi]GAW81591.1 hypothetical protein, conserved [Plasmodium gonderi]
MNLNFDTLDNFIMQETKNSATRMGDLNHLLGKVKHHIRRHFQLNKNFYEWFLSLVENSECLRHNLNTNFKEMKKNIMDYTLNDEEFLKKKKNENCLKQKLSAVEELIRSLSLVVRQVDENCKNLKELFFCLYMSIFEFPFDGEPEACSLTSHVVHCGKDISDVSDSSDSSAALDPFSFYTRGDVDPTVAVDVKRRESRNKMMTESTIVSSLLSQNKINGHELEVGLTKNTFVSDFYTNGEINKMIKRCFTLSHEPSLCFHPWTKQVKLFFLLTAVIFYMEKDFKVRVQICNLILSEIHINSVNIKKCTIILNYNPYLNNIKRILNMF